MLFLDDFSKDSINTRCPAPFFVFRFSGKSVRSFRVSLLSDPASFRMRPLISVFLALTPVAFAQYVLEDDYTTGSFASNWNFFTVSLLLVSNRGRF